MKRLKRWFSGFLVLCLCMSVIPIQAEAIAYSNYTGVDFQNANISTQRKAALTKAMQMVTVKWTCPAYFPTWRSSKGVLNTVVATDGTSSTKFIKGKTYTGIPYSMADHTYDDIAWTNALANGQITTSYMTGSYYGNGNTTAHGSDCSYLVYLALKAANAGSITYQTTAAMLNSSLYKKIAWEELKPADLFLKNGHVMMFVGMSGDKYAVFECNAGDSKCAYNVYSKSQLSSYDCYRYVNFSEPMYADLGTDFYAVILNTACWKPINLDSDGFVSLETEVGKSQQVWKFVRQDDGSYTISSSKNGKLLEMYCGDTTPGNPVAAVSDDWGGNYQRWYLYPQGNGYVLLSKHFAESNLVLDLTNNNSTDGTAIITYPRNNGAAQIWSIYRGDDVQLSGPNLTVSPGTSSSKTKFTWNDIYGETRYDVKIWKNAAWEGDAYHIEWGANSGYSINLPAGTYQAYVDAANHFETKMSNLVTFTVKEHVHNYTSKVTSPTCTAQGYTTYTCSSCGYSYKGNYTNALGHSFSYKITKVPTTAATGTITGTCSRCSGTTTVTLPKLNTTDYTYKVITAATCTTNGTGRYTWKNTSYGTYHFDVTIGKSGHSYTSRVTAPTCTVQGYTTYTCNCGYSYTGNYTNALGHSYSYKTTKVPTTAATGTVTGTCSRCAGTTVVTLPMLNTTDYGYSVTKAATCTDTGTGRYTWKTTTYGSFCFDVTIASTGHSYASILTAPTCTKQGYTTHTCTKCSDSYTDQYVAATGHSYVDGVCKACGDVIATVNAPKLTATNVASSGKIKLSWNAVEGAESYQLYRSTSQDGTYTLLKTTTSTSMTNTYTTAGKTYYYYVVAVGEDGMVSEASNIVSRTCDLAQPEITLSNVASTGKIKVSWDEVDGAVKYKVYRSTSENGTYTLLKTTTNTSLTNTSATAGKTYYYKVKAIAENSVANSAYSAIKSRTCDLAQPEITLSNVASTGKIKVSWDAIDGAVKYKVYRSTSKNGTYTLLKTTTNTSLTNTSTTAGKTYYYKVKAIAEKSAADSAYSSIKSRTCDLARPVAEVYLNSKGKPVVDWNAVSGAVKYTVYIYDANGNQIKTTSTTSTKLTHSSAVKGKTYSYRVVAVASNSTANSAKSVKISIKSK